VIARWKGIIEEIHFGGSIMPLAIIENLDLEKPSFRPSKWPRKLKPAKNSKLPKLPESCFEPVGKGGWPPISTWINLYLCKNSQLKQKVLLELHTSPVGGHSGFLKTYHRVKKDFFWDGLKTDVQRFVAECLVCQQNKVETIKTPGLLQPLAIPSQRWEEVSMDFITGLPKSEGKSVIMVIVDRLTKYTHFCALSHPFKASTVATAFMETVQKLHGAQRLL
jgi:hypothetical protein